MRAAGAYPVTAFAQDDDGLVDPDAILRARARALASVPEPVPAEGTLARLLEFRLAHERYAVETTRVREVVVLRALTLLPCVPHFIRGIINVRGRITPVIDLKRFVDLPESGITDLHHVVLIEAGGQEIGLLADAISGERVVERAGLQASLPTLTGIRADYLLGATGDGMVVLDAVRILADPRIVVDEELGT